MREVLGPGVDLTGLVLEIEKPHERLSFIRLLVCTPGLENDGSFEDYELILGGLEKSERLIGRYVRARAQHLGTSLSQVITVMPTFKRTLDRAEIPCTSYNMLRLDEYETLDQRATAYRHYQGS